LSGERLGGLPREVAEHAHEEGQLLHLDRAAALDLVRDLDAGWANAFEFLLGAVGHARLLVKGPETERRTSGQHAEATVPRDEALDVL
jgi:hypothetical protein